MEKKGKKGREAGTTQGESENKRDRDNALSFFEPY